MLIPRRIVRNSLLAGIALLAIGFAATHLLKLYGNHEDALGFRRLFNMDGEGNLPTWFSSTLMLAASALLAVIAIVRTRSADRFRRHWWGLAAGFLYMSADETGQIHEMLDRLGHALPIRSSGALAWPWVVFGLLAVGTVAITYLRFLVHLSPATRRAFLTAGICFVAGAIGVEMLTAAVYAGPQGLDLQPSGWDERGDFPLGYMLLVMAEESLELLGLTLFIDALLGYVGAEWGQLSIGVVDRPHSV